MPTAGGAIAGPAPSRTLDPAITIFSASDIRVAVLPLGMVPRDVLDEYLQLMQRFRTMSLSAIRSFYQRRSDKTPFQSLDWGSGALHFRFMQVEEARRKSRLVELHPSRQVVAVLGLMHCPVNPSIAQAYDEFNRVCREQFPEARVTRCFVFEPSDDHILQDNQQHIPGLVVFPPAGGQAHLKQHLEVWMHDLAALVLAELEQWVLDPTPRAMPRPKESYTDSSEFVGSVTMMEEVAKRLALPDDEVREKRRRGRLHKAQGDVCLMAGSSKDAVNHYRVAQDLTKATNDWVWYGAVLEALAYVRLIDAPAPAPRSSQSAPLTPASSSTAGAIPPASSAAASTQTLGPAGWPSWEVLRSRGVDGEVMEMLLEARGCYKKRSVAIMQVECSLKLARLLLGLRGRQAARRDIIDTANWIVEAGASLHYLEDRLVALAEASQLYGSAGAARRRTLLLWVAADMARGIDKHEMLRLAIKGVEPPEDETDNQDILYTDPNLRLHWSLRQAGLPARAWHAATGSGSASSVLLPQKPPPGVAPVAHRGAAWHPIQLLMQDMLLQAARQNGAPSEAWDATAAMLRHHLSALPSASHAPMLENLALAASALPPKLKLRPGLGPPCPLARLRRILPLSSQHQPLRVAGRLGQPSGSNAPTDGHKTAAVQDPAEKSPFIFNPNADKRRDLKEKERSRRRGVADAAELMLSAEWVCGEEGRVEVELLNPLAVPVKIESISLHARYTSSAGAAGCSTGPGTGVAGAGPGVGPSPASGAVLTPEQHVLAVWRASPTQLVLPASSKAVKVQLRCTALAPGTLTLSGLKVSALGAQWFEPFGLHTQQPSSSLGAGLGIGGPGSLKSYQHRFSTGSSLGSTTGAASGDSPAAGMQWRQATITVLPALPMLQAVLKDNERRPDEEALAIAPLPDEPAAEASGSNGSVLTATGPPTAAAPASAPLGRASASTTELPVAHAPAGQAAPPLQPAVPVTRVPSAAALAAVARRGAVPVWQGQRCCWDLCISNQGSTPVTSAQVTVVNQKGVLLKPLPQGHAQASFGGVHLQLSSKGIAALAAAMPMAPGATVVLPFDVYVGQPPADAYEEVALEVRIVYTGPSASSGAVSQELLGRQLTLPMRFQVQPTVQVSRLQFVDVMLPLKNGTRDCAQIIIQESANSVPWGSHNVKPTGPNLPGRLSHPAPNLLLTPSYGSQISLGEGFNALPAWSKSSMNLTRPDSQMFWQPQDPDSDFSAAPTPSGISNRSNSWDGTSIRPEAGSQPSTSGVAGQMDTRISLSSDCFMHVSVVSMCERYLRVWLERLPAVGSKEQASSRAAGGDLAPGNSNVVLPPGEATSLHCSTPLTALASTSASTLPAQPPVQYPDRTASASILCNSWVVAWRMIAPGEEESNAPSGCVHLPLVDVAQSLTSQATATLQPSHLSFHLTAVYTPTCEQVPPPRPRVQDLTHYLQEPGLQPAAPVGELWGVRLGIGELVELEVEARSSCSGSQLLQFSLAATRLACHPGPLVLGVDQAAAQLEQGSVYGTAAGWLKADPGVLLLGQTEKVRCKVDAGSSHIHRLSMMFVQPGMYQLYVTDAQTTTSQAELLSQEGLPHWSILGGQVWGEASKAYANVERMNVICL